MRTFLTVVCALGVSSCASVPDKPLTFAFDHLTSESTESFLSLLSYRNVVSVSGILPSHGPGSLVYQPTDHSASHSICVSPKWSFVAIEDYPLDRTFPGLVDPFASILQSFKDLQSVAARLTAVSEVISTVERALNRADQKSAAEKQAIYEKAGKALGLDCDTACKKAEIDTALSERKALRQSLQKEFESAKAAFSRLTTGANIIITRWGRQESSNGEVGFGWSGAKFGVGGASHNQSSGVAIFAGFRVRTTCFGEDFLETLREWSKEESEQSGGMAALGATTRLMGMTAFEVRAKYREYFSDADFQASIDAHLGATLEELAALKNLAGLPAARVDLAFVAEAAASMSNRGRLLKSTAQVFNYCFFPARVWEQFDINHRARDRDYRVIQIIRPGPSSLTAAIASALSNKGALTSPLSKRETEAFKPQWELYKEYCNDGLHFKPADRADLKALWLTTPPAAYNPQQPKK